MTSERKNPNPLCFCCGRPTKTMDHYFTSRGGHKMASRWRTSCNNALSCSISGREGDICGEGTTIKEARQDYILKAAKRHEGE